MDQYVPRGVTYLPCFILMDPNPIRTALNVCKDLIAHKVYAVIVSHPLTGDLSPAAVSYTSGFYHIPVIGISSRDSAFSDKVRFESIPASSVILFVLTRRRRMKTDVNRVTVSALH